MNPATGEAPLPLTGRQWLWAATVGVLFLGATAVGVRYAELVTGRYITAGVPPIPAVAALLLLVPLARFLRRLPAPWPRLALERRQILLVFLMVCLGAALDGQYMLRAFLPHLGVLHYWPGHGHSALHRWVEYFPLWYAPTDAEAWRQYYEGSRGAGVPWGLWLLPLGRWSLFFVALFATAAGLVSLFRRQWIQQERLSFPLLYLPLTFTAENTLFGGKPLLRHPLFWLGTALPALHNGINIARALNPAVPAPGFYFSFNGMFPDPPWTQFNSVMLFFMPEAVGFGYFIPQEITFSAWFFYLAVKLAAAAGIAAGAEAPGYPFIQDQAAGAYLGTAGLLLYGARARLSALVRRSLGLSRGRLTEEEREERLALFAFLGGLVFLLTWAWAAGFRPILAVPFFTILFCFVLVYARLRAETGVPFEFIYPFSQPKEMLVNALTPRGALDLAGPRSWVVFAGFGWLSRHHTVQGMAAYAIDGCKLAEEGGISRRMLWGALGVALVAALAIGFWAHLEVFYALGCNLTGGGVGEGRAAVALQEFQKMASQAAAGPPRNEQRLAAQGLGAVLAVGLGLSRQIWLRSPFHPLGYILATAYGNHTTLFFPLFLAWVLKSLVLKLGGLRLYRSLIPLFLGVILGHYAIGGMFWPAFSLLLAPEASRSYHIHFAG
ncbi:MAG: hypothetical protein FJX77_09470 [Armatimonadetes bacterium]|nr:hypothetical protein [Armatimonadota bacterium]